MTSNSDIEVLFFSNGNTVVMKNNKQVAELQQSWLLTFVAFLEEKGIDVTKVKFRLPSGQTAEVFITSNGEYNWRLING